MPRNSKGGRQASIAEEDYYDYEEEEELDAEAQLYLAGGAGQRQPAPKAAAKKAPPPFYAGDADKELLDAAIPHIESVVGKKFTTKDIVGALRTANYDADEAVDVLLSKPETQRQAPSTDRKPAPRPPAPAEETAAKCEPVKVEEKPAPTLSPAPAPTPAPAPAPEAVAVASPVKAEPAMEKEGSGMSPQPSAAGSEASPAPERKAAREVFDSDGKQAINIIIAGHVDCGKSTILGHLLVKLGHYTDRHIMKLEKECKEIGKASFQYAWVMDQSEEERRRGVTIDAGMQFFDTTSKRVTVFDCPGHKEFVTSMITSATQADVGVLVVTAVQGEFESGLANCTKEHLTVMRTLGINQIIVAVNKMDAIKFSQERFDHVVTTMKQLLKACRFKEADIVGFCPISGLMGINLKDKDDGANMPWYKANQSLFDLIDGVQVVKRNVDGPLRFVVHDVGKNQVAGVLESGTLKNSDKIVFVPSGIKTGIKAIEKQGANLSAVQAGDNVDVTFPSGTDISALRPGNVGCHPTNLVPVSNLFEAHIQTFPELPNVILPGVDFMMQIHALSISVRVVKLLKKMDLKAGTWAKGMVKRVARDEQALVLFQTDFPFPMETIDDSKGMGRFILRQKGDTVGGGLIRKVVPKVEKAPQ